MRVACFRGAGSASGRRERGRALVLISHDLQLPAALGGRVIALRAGRIVARLADTRSAA